MKVECQKEYCKNCSFAAIETRLSRRLHDDPKNKDLWNKYIEVAKITKAYDIEYDGPMGPKALFLYFADIP